jgi:hypothetical protein
LDLKYPSHIGLLGCTEHPTWWGDISSFAPHFCKKKSRPKSLHFLSTSFGTSKNENISKWGLLGTEFNIVNLPPTESNFLFQLLRHFWNLSKACFQLEFVRFLWCIGIPGYRKSHAGYIKELPTLEVIKQGIL